MFDNSRDKVILDDRRDRVEDDLIRAKVIVVFIFLTVVFASNLANATDLFIVTRNLLST